jgi:hypothetical protein
MHGESGARLTISVGKREFENLTDAWTAYTDATQSKTAVIDPVLALQRTGDILRSLAAVLATLGVEPEKPGKDGKNPLAGEPPHEQEPCGITP